MSLDTPSWPCLLGTPTGPMAATLFFTNIPHLLGTQEGYISLLLKLDVATWLTLASKLR